MNQQKKDYQAVGAKDFLRNFSNSKFEAAITQIKR